MTSLSLKYDERADCFSLLYSPLKGLFCVLAAVGVVEKDEVFGVTEGDEEKFKTDFLAVRFTRMLEITNDFCVKTRKLQSEFRAKMTRY